MNKSKSLFAVKIYHSQRTETVNFESFESADELVEEMSQTGTRIEAYELRDGRTLDMYTGEDIDDRYDEYLNKLNSLM
jgi:hypothetical protein